MNEMRMEPHGLTNDNQIVACQIVDLVEGEYLSGIGFGFTSTDLIQFIYKSSFKQTLAYGGVSEKTLQTPMATFDKNDIEFFGFNSRSGPGGQLTALSVIAYESSCMDKFKEEQGENFTWTERTLPTDPVEPVKPEPKPDPPQPVKPVIPPKPVEPEPEPQPEPEPVKPVIEEPVTPEP